MTATTEPRGGLDFGWVPGEDGWGPNMNANILRLSRFGFHASVLSMTTTAPPGSPTSGAGYIIPAGATGAWSGKTGQVAVWDGSAWAYAVPRDGWTVHVVNVGLVVYEDGAWSQSNLATASGVGAEPYAGAPAQTSFWRSTAAGVRAWVQLVAADITDLATTLAGYLTKHNPSWTGTMDGGSGATFRMSSLQGGLGNDFVCADMIGFIRKVTPSQALANMQGMSLALKGAANGVAELGADGRVPTGQLPSYVDDVLEYANFAAFPAAGETGKIYVNLDQNKTWRWSGSAYVEISASLALGETPATAYRGDRGVIAYNHSQLTTGNPHGTTAADVGAAPLAGAELLIHSDFGRTVTTSGWQSTFTSNSASGLLLQANTITNGTQIRFEQLFDNAASASGAWQLAIGPLLPAGTGPSYPAYLDVIDTTTISSSPGTLMIEVEFLGSGATMTAHVSSRVFCDAFGGSGMQVSNGTIPFDATIDRRLDIQVQPAGMTDPVIRRNRVFRRNP